MVTVVVLWVPEGTVTAAGLLVLHVRGGFERMLPNSSFTVASIVFDVPAATDTNVVFSFWTVSSMERTKHVLNGIALLFTPLTDVDICVNPGATAVART